MKWKNQKKKLKQIEKGISSCFDIVIKEIGKEEEEDRLGLNECTNKN